METKTAIGQGTRVMVTVENELVARLDVTRYGCVEGSGSWGASVLGMVGVLEGVDERTNCLETWPWG